MGETEDLVRGLNQITDLLGLDSMNPDPTRQDWAGSQNEVRQLSEHVEAALKMMPSGLAAVEDADARTRLAEGAVNILGDAAATLQAAGETGAATRTISAAISHAPGGLVSDELQAARMDTKHWQMLVHARWLWENNQIGKAKKLLKVVTSDTREPALARAAAAVLKTPRAITSAPALFTLNGFGVSVYGNRDRWADESYVKTLCICLLFVPVFPLVAYRVFDGDEGGYVFMAKVELSKFARAVQALVVVGILGGVGVGVVGGYLDSPARLAGIAVTEAAQVEESQGPEAALPAYMAVLKSYAHRSGTRDSVREAGAAVIRLNLLGVDDESGVRRVLGVYRGLPSGAQGPRAKAAMTQKLREIAAKSEPQSALHLLEIATTTCQAKDRPLIMADRNRIRLGLAREQEEQWPRNALALYLDAKATDDAQRVLGKLVDEVLLEDAEQIVGYAGLEARLRAVKDRVAADDRKVALESGVVKTLARWVKAHPEDEGAVAALATAHFDRGDLKATLATLGRLGLPGARPRETQRLLIAAHTSADELEAADAIASHYLALRMPAFAAARDAYGSHFDQVRASFVSIAREGRDVSLRRKLDAAPNDESAGRIFDEWLTKKMDADARLATLRASYGGFSDVVPVSLQMGTIKLRRAAGASGEVRAAYLKEAERAFLAIRAESAGTPSFHLGLGETYYRLGKAKEGDAELQKVLNTSPDLALQVCSTYRSVGAVGRAMEVAEQSYKLGKAEVRSDAAMMMAIMSADLDDKQAWLEKSDPDDPSIQSRLASVRGRRFLRAGEPDKADKEFVKVLSFQLKGAKSNPVLANNAAITLQFRYQCTGKVEHLVRASKLLSSALKMSPDDSLVMGNLADVLRTQGTLVLVKRWVDTQALGLDGQDASSLYWVLRDGPLGEALAEASRLQPALVRAASLQRQEQVMAPGRPGPYFRDMAQLSMAKDTEGLRKLLARIHEHEIDGTGSEDTVLTEERRAAAEARVSELLAERKRVVKSVQGHRSARTRAAALFLQYGAQASLAETTGDPALVAAAIVSVQQAVALWPELDLEDVLPTLYLKQAILSVPELAQLRRMSGASFNIFVLAHYEAQLSVVRSQPGLRRAVEAAKALARPEPVASDWVLAKVAGDTGLEASAAAVFKSDRAYLLIQIASALQPMSESAKATLALFKAHRD